MTLAMTATKYLKLLMDVKMKIFKDQVKEDMKVEVAFYPSAWEWLCPECRLINIRQDFRAQEIYDGCNAKFKGVEEK